MDLRDRPELAADTVEVSNAVSIVTMVYAHADGAASVEDPFASFQQHAGDRKLGASSQAREL